MTLEEEFFEWKSNQRGIDQLFEIIKVLTTRIDTINERTKIHTLDIRNLRKLMKGGKKDEIKNKR